MLKRHKVISAAIAVCLPLFASARGADTFFDQVAVTGRIAWFKTPKELCRTDGTPAGTRCDPNPARTYEAPQVIGDKVYLDGGGWDGPLIVYVADANTPPTKLVELEPYAHTFGLRSNGTHLFYFAQRLDGIDLMKLDVDSRQVSRVKSFQTNGIDHIVRAGSSLLFRVRDTSRWAPAWKSTYDAWRSDGSPDGTTLLLPAIGIITPLESSALITAGKKVWRTDGTPTGTFPLADGYPSEITSANGASTFAIGKTVWRADARSITSIASLPFAPNAVADLASRLLVLEQQQYPLTWRFHADAGSGTRELLATTAARDHGAYSDVVQAGGLAFVRLDGVQDSRELWRSDGTREGTFRLTGATPNSASNTGFAVVGDKLLFSGTDGVHGYEPWISDGTNEGTMMLANLSGEGTVRGQVTEASTGKPVAGVVVELREYETVRATATTGNDGRYVLDGVIGFDLTVRVRGNGTHLPYTQSRRFALAAGGEATVDVALEPGARVSGRVVDERGTPLPGLQVRLATHILANPPMFTRSAADGTYSFDQLPAGGPWLLWVPDHLGYVMNTAPLSVTVAPGEARQVDITMKPWGRVVLRVLDAVTLGAMGDANHSVFFTGTRNERFFVKLNADGTGTMSLPDDTYTLTMSVGDYEAPSPPIRLEKVVPGSNTVIELRLQPRGARVAGRVVDAASGRGIANANVLMERSSDRQRIHARTDASGFYITRPTLQPGTYEVYAGAANFSASARRSVTVGPLEILSGIDFAVTRTASIVGRVIDAHAGIPVIAALVSADGQPPVGTGSDGRFMLYQIRPGAVVVTAVGAGWKATRTTLTLQPGEEGTVDILIEPDCAKVLTPSWASVPTEGGRFRFRVTAPPGCAYPLNSPDGWTVGRAVEGTNEVEVIVGANESRKSRTGIISMPGAIFVVKQAGPE